MSFASAVGLFDTKRFLLCLLQGASVSGHGISFVSILGLFCSYTRSLLPLLSFVFVAEFGWEHLSAGDLLRAERATDSPNAQALKKIEKQ